MCKKCNITGLKKRKDVEIRNNTRLKSKWLTGFDSLTKIAKKKKKIVVYLLSFKPSGVILTILNAT
ncbi:MAG TPA: hypothetical protein ENJ75_00965 [Candidatus Kaiserbacteria bacterium]|nr:hypothetical protein [Candidatus Kaiserbacteria bacterium]